MSTHAFFSPSKAHMWASCFGALAMPQNQEEGGSSKYADDGTASHQLLDSCLSDETDTEFYQGLTTDINGVAYCFDEDRCTRIQGVVDDARRRALGGVLWSEYRVDLSFCLGDKQGGTADVVILQPRLEEITVLDLKDGSGEKVFAKYGSEDLPAHKRINKQLGLYLVGVWRDADLLGKFTKGRVVINQPKLGHIDEFDISQEELMLFAEMMANAVAENGAAMVVGPHGYDSTYQPDFLLYLNPSEKACRWCRAKAACPKLGAWIQEQTASDFEVIADEPPVAPTDDARLGLAKAAVPLIEMWCKAVNKEVWDRTSAGKKVIGPDGLPYKFVHGKQGNRAWENEAKAEAALVGQLGDEAYQPRKVITAPAAGAILDKKKTKELWKDIFEPMIARGKPGVSLVPGSDPRPPASGAASADEFIDDIEV